MSEVEAAAIRAAFEQGGEFSAAIELRRLPGAAGKPDAAATRERVMNAARDAQEPRRVLRHLRRRLRVLRLWNGPSEAEVAIALGISVRSLKGREAGTLGSRGVTHVMIAAAETFGVSIDWLHDTKVAGAYRDDTQPLTPDGKPLSETLEAVP